MKKLAILLLILVLTVQCRSRKKTASFTEYRTAEISKIDSNTVISTEVKDSTIAKIEKHTERKDRQNEGNITIKGKADSLNDFHFHNVVNGDTLSDITIKGNADFIIKNRWQNRDNKEETKTASESLNVVAKIARKAVAQSTIKETAGSIKQIDKEIKATGFPLPVYIIAGILAIVVIWLFWFFGRPKKN